MKYYLKDFNGCPIFEVEIKESDELVLKDFEIVEVK